MNTEEFNQTVDTIASECLAVRMRLLNRVVTNIFDDALRPLGIKVSQLNVLMVIARRCPVSATDIGQVLHLEKSTLSRNLERIRKQGWIEVANASSGRNAMLTLTTKGKRLVQKAQPLWDKAQEGTRKMIGKNGAKAIKQAAKRVQLAK